LAFTAGVKVSVPDDDIEGCAEKSVILLLVTLKVRVCSASGSPSLIAVAHPETVWAPASSATVWFPPLAKDGGSFTAVTVKVAALLFDRNPGSVAVNVIVTEPFQSGSGIVTDATLFDIDTLSGALPE